MFRHILLVALALSIGTAVSNGQAQTLVVAAQKTPNGVDHDFHVTTEDHKIRAALYDKLLVLGRKTGPDGLIVPSYDHDDLVGRLAESWKVSDDRKTLTVKLRKGVMSHAGNELTAADVQWTWDRSWAVKAVGAFYAKVNLHLTEPMWRVVDRYTWEISTPVVSSLLELLMINNDLDVIDSTEAKKHATAEDPWAKEWLATHDAGFGAYRLTEWVPGEKVVLEAFEGYFRGTPHFKTVIFREVPLAANRLALVSKGQVKIAENLPPRFLKRAEDNEDLKIWKTLGNRRFVLNLNHKMEPTNDARVRQALAYATPITQILKQIFLGYAEPLKSAVPTVYPGYAGEYWKYDYDPEKAKQLLEDAGAVGSELVMSYDSSSRLHEETAAILKTEYEAIGLKVRLNPMAAAPYKSKFYKRELQAFFQTGFPILPDPEYSLALVFTCDSFLNTTAYCNKNVDEMLVQASQTNDRAAAMQLYKEVQRIMVAEDAVVLMIAQPGWQLVTSKDLKGVNWDTPNLYQFFDLH